jgi:hypothetical protein
MKQASLRGHTRIHLRKHQDPSAKKKDAGARPKLTSWERWVGAFAERHWKFKLIETVLPGLLDRRRCGGNLVIIGLNRPQNLGVYFVFN